MHHVVKSDYSVQNDESLYKWEKSQKAGQESEKRCDLRRQQKMEREETAVTCDGRLFHRRAAATGNALSPTVDRRVRRTSRDVDEAVWHSMHYIIINYLSSSTYRLKRSSIAVNETPFHSYGVSLVIWDHTVLPATWHKSTHPTLIPARQASTRFTYPRGMEGWVDLGDWLHTKIVYPLTDGHPSKY